MAKLGISTGTIPNDGTGDALLSGAVKINSNFTEIYNRFGDGTNLTAIGGTWASNSVGVHTLRSVGIGTTNPTQNLHVRGNIRVTGGIYDSNNNVGSAGSVLTSNGTVVYWSPLNSGAQGAQGVQGTQGIQGAQGVQGTAGPAGPQGVQGAQGATGSTGPQGVQGAQGRQGAQGAAGPTGPQGVQGSLGTQGAQGFQGTSGTSVTIVGSLALTVGNEQTELNNNSNSWYPPVAGYGVIDSNTGNLWVYDGSLWNNVGTIVGPQGYQGSQGDAGSQGAQGRQGVQGATGTTGSQGLTGGTGPQGIQGATGPQGSQGFKGDSYWASTIVGINTLSNVGIGTTNATNTLTVGGGTSTTNLYVSGVSTFNGTTNLTATNINGTVNINGGTWYYVNNVPTYYGNGLNGFISYLTSTNTFDIRVPTASQSLVLGAGPSVRITNENGLTDRAVFTSSGVKVIGITTTDNLNVGTGGTVITTTTGGSVGIGTTNATNTLTVGGGTSTRDLYVTGVSTFKDTTNLSTTNISGDVTFTGNNDLYLKDLGVINFGDSNDLQIFHNGSVSVIRDGGTGGLLIDSDNEIKLAKNGTGNDTLAIFTPDGSVELYYDNSKKLETTSSGVSIGGTISVDGGVKLATNNSTIVGTSGTTGEIKRIGGAPFFYDGTAWREFVLSSGTPVSVPADTEWDSVIYRNTFDTDFTDAKFGVSPSFVSTGSSIVGAAYTIGTASFRNLGGSVNGIGVSYADRTEYDFTGSWTIEFWIYHDTLDANKYLSLISQYSTPNDPGNWTFGLFNSNNSSVVFYWSNENDNTNSTRAIKSISYTDFSNSYLNKWKHYALVREGSSGSLHFYVDGVESSSTTGNSIIDNNILHTSGAGLYIGAPSQGQVPQINGVTWNFNASIDAFFDDMRISAGVGTAGQRYTSIGISTYATFTPPSTALPTTGTLSSKVNPPGDKYGEIVLGASPIWRGTSGVTVSQQSSGNYRVSFASTYTNNYDYFVLTQPMDQGFASYVGVARSTSYTDFSINRQSNNAAVDTGSLAVQIKNRV